MAGKGQHRRVLEEEDGQVIRQIRYGCSTNASPPWLTSSCYCGCSQTVHSDHSLRNIVKKAAQAPRRVLRLYPVRGLFHAGNFWILSFLVNASDSNLRPSDYERLDALYFFEISEETNHKS